jgi:hypothetical protein
MQTRLLQLDANPMAAFPIKAMMALKLHGHRNRDKTLMQMTTPRHPSWPNCQHSIGRAGAIHTEAIDEHFASRVEM